LAKAYFLRGGNAGNPLQIFCDLQVAPLGEQFSNTLHNGAADLHQQPSAELEFFVSFRDKPCDDFKPGWSGEYGTSWFESANLELDLILF